MSNVKQMFRDYQEISETAKKILMECSSLIIVYEQQPWGQYAVPDIVNTAEDVVNRYKSFLLEARGFLTDKNKKCRELEIAWKNRKQNRMKIEDLNWALIELFSDMSGHIQFIQDSGIHEINEAIKLKLASQQTNSKPIEAPTQVN